MTNKRLTTGLFESPYDARDALGEMFITPKKLPASFQLKRLPNVKNQGQKYSCVGQTMARWIEYANDKENDIHYNSARYIYAYCKLLDGQPSLQGTFFRVALDVAKDKGDATTNEWGDFTTLPDADYIARPSAEADRSAIPFRINNYVTTTNIDVVKQYILDNELPVLMGINGNNTCWSNQVVKNNNYTLTEPTGSLLGHAVLCVGWNEQGLIFENSWGEGWGDAGRCLCPYNYKYLQTSFWMPYDLPNNWKQIRDIYLMKNKMMTIGQALLIIIGLYQSWLNRTPGESEMPAVNAHANKLIYEVNRKNAEGIRQVLDGFKKEFYDRVKSGDIVM